MSYELEKDVWLELTADRNRSYRWPKLRAALRMREPSHRPGVVRIKVKLKVPESLFQLPVVTREINVTEGMVIADAVTIEAQEGASE